MTCYRANVRLRHYLSQTRTVEAARGATEIGMVRAIFEEAPLRISPEYTAKQLLVLAGSQPPAVRTAACLQFRDLVGGLFQARPAEASALGRELGVSASDAERWLRLEQQNGGGKELVGWRFPADYIAVEFPPA